MQAVANTQKGNCGPVGSNPTLSAILLSGSCSEVSLTSPSSVANGGGTFSRIEEVAHSKGYRVTDDGRVLNPIGRQLAAHPDRCGYPQFNVGESKCRVHRLSAFQKFGDAIYREGICVRHLDNNSGNPRPDNLILGTNSDNMMDVPAEVRLRKARAAAALITKHDHVEVVAFHQTSRSYRATMERFGIRSKGTLNFILKQSHASKPQAA